MQAGETTGAAMDTNVVAVAGITRVSYLYQSFSPDDYTVRVYASIAQSTIACSQCCLCRRHAVHAIATLLHPVLFALLNP